MYVTARDVAGELLPSPYAVYLDYLTRRRPPRVARNVPPDGRAKFDTAWQHTYRVRVVCEGHAEVARNVDGSIDDVELAVPVDPSAVVGYEWPSPWPEIPGVDWPELVGSPERTAAALNVWAKLWQTTLGVVPAGAYIDEVLEVRPDRLICRAAWALEQAAAAATGGDDPVLDSVDGSLHHPPDDYELGPSYKTFDDAGNLQLTFFVPVNRRALGPPLLVDVDIDKARGIAHWFEVVENALTGHTTNQVDVREILRAAGIDPGWRPLLAA